jgi:putative peptide zinc metalloprotease protein
VQSNSLPYVIAREKEDVYIVSTSGGRHFTVNGKTRNLLHALSSTTTVDDAYAHYCRHTQAQLDPVTFRNVTSSFLREMEDSPPSQASAYLRWKWEIIEGDRLASALKWLAPLWSRFIFWPLLIAIFCVAFGSVLMRFERISLFQMPVAFWLALPIALAIHELGHVLAARCLGATPGKVGFGLYLFFPVAFADVTDCWRLRRKERVMVDLSGVYLEGLLATAILMGAFAFSSSSFRALAVLLFAKILAQMIPFLRKDGYWVLSDLTSEPNLLKRSAAGAGKFATLMFRLRLAEALAMWRKEWGRILYGSANAAVIGLFVIGLTLFAIRQLKDFRHNFSPEGGLVDVSLVPRQLLVLLILGLTFARIVRFLIARFTKTDFSCAANSGVAHVPEQTACNMKVPNERSDKNSPERRCGSLQTRGVGAAAGV